jgi:small subunit ribosomal protein S4e
MAHTKKSQMSKSWPVPRKTRTMRFVAVPQHAKAKAINLLFILREVLGIASTRKEAKKILHQGDVKVNNLVRKTETFPVQIFDTISLEKSDKYYRLEIVNRKFSLKEIKKTETNTKIVKIAGKTILAEGKVQMNLEDGTNILSKDSFNQGDSVVLNTEKSSIEKVLPLKEKAKVEIISGKHAGEKGELMEIVDLSRGKSYKIKLEDKEVSLPYKTVLVIK